MKKKIFFFDIDGTIYSHENGVNVITERVKQAIHKTKEQGHLCFIASGRILPFVSEEIKSMNFNGYVLCNGAHLIYNDKNLKIQYLDYYKLKKVISLLDEHNIEYIFQTENYGYVNKDHQCMIDFFKQVGVNQDTVIFDFDKDEVMKRTLKIEVWVKDEKEMKHAVEAFDGLYYEIHPDQHSIEVCAKEVTKATGILDVLDLLNMEVEDSYCFGDGPNDIGMFEVVGHPIAMGNAIDKLKEIAEEVCLSVLEDGVAIKLEEILKAEA